MIDPPAARRERGVAAVLVGMAVLFVGLSIRRVSTVSSVGLAGALSLPLVLLAADLVIAAALLTGWYPIRPVAQGLAVFGVLAHALVALRGGPVWTRGCSGVLVLAHGWAMTLLFMLTATEDAELDEEQAVLTEGPTAVDESGELDEEPPPRTPSGASVDDHAPVAHPHETPVLEVVEVAVPEETDPDHDHGPHEPGHEEQPDRDTEERIR